MAISITTTGSFNNTDQFLKRMSKVDILSILDEYGKAGVEALKNTTPEDSGLTADSWAYEIEASGGNYAIYWTNSHVHDGVYIAVLLEYGHATGTHGYVQGRDYINPAIRPIFDQIANSVWKVVTSS
jgi:hypothetical protein